MLDPQDIAVALAYRALGLIGYAHCANSTHPWQHQRLRPMGGATKREGGEVALSAFCGRAVQIAAG